MTGQVLVRLTPTERTHAVTVLRALLGRDITATDGRRWRVHTSEEHALIDAVRFAGVRGYSMAMHPATADRIADLLDRATPEAGMPELAARFRTGRRPARRTRTGTWALADRG